MRRCGPLTEEALERIVERSKQRHPKKTNFDQPAHDLIEWPEFNMMSALGQQFEMKRPSPEEIAAYDTLTINGFPACANTHGRL